MRFDEQIGQLEQSISECERYIKKAKLAIIRLQSEQRSSYGCISTKEMGAVRRAALDVRREMTTINQLKMF